MRLQRLHDSFREIRTMCTGIMGYLAMLHEGDFEGHEGAILKEVQAAAASATQKLEALRDAAASIPHGANTAVDEVAPVIVSSEEGMRQSL